MGRSKHTVENSYTYIPKQTSFYHIPHTRTKNIIQSNCPSRKELIEDFINSLPEIINSEK